MRWISLLLPTLPIAAGLPVIVLVVVASNNTPPVLFARVDLGTAVAIVSLLLSLILFGGVLMQRWLNYLQAQSIAMVQHQAAEDRRRFLQRLDHELKNPLMGIRAGLANITSQTDDSADYRTIASVEAQALRLSRLASDLRKLADLETRPLERQTIDTAALLQDVIALAEEQPAAVERRLVLTLPQAPWSLGSLNGDYDLLFLGLYNLVDNALKFTQSEDTIEIRAFEDGSTLVIEVADTGPGIPEEDQAYVWDELYRAPAARGISGSGLGLPLVRAIMYRHDGHVGLRSRVEQGTVVTVRIPMQDQRT